MHNADMQSACDEMLLTQSHSYATLFKGIVSGALVPRDATLAFYSQFSINQACSLM